MVQSDKYMYIKLKKLIKNNRLYRLSPQPLTEDSLLLSGELEYPNEPYAIAKIAGIKLCESYNLQYGTNFISVMPTNLYGQNDNFDLETSHALPALIRKIHEAKIKQNKEVEIWGSGKPRREFLYVDDMAEACVFIMNSVDFKDLYQDNQEVRNTHINISTGEDISIKALAELIKKIVGFEGRLVFNADKPDGTMVKRTDITKINNLGWYANMELSDGIEKVYQWYCSLNIQ